MSLHWPKSLYGVTPEGVEWEAILLQTKVGVGQR